MTEQNVSEFSRSVVVGVDGSAESWRAVTAAAWEAQHRGVPLTLLHGYLERYPYASYGWAPYLPIGPEAGDSAQVLLDDTAARLARLHPDLPVQTMISPGGGPAALIAASAKAGLVVVGARGHGGFGGLSVGSVAAQTAAHASCPVMVIRPPQETDDTDTDGPAVASGDTWAGSWSPRRGPVVVGVDGSDYEDAVLQFAFEEASRRRVPLVATYVWLVLPGGNLGPVAPGQYDAVAADNEAARLLSEAVAGWGSKYPDVVVEQRPVRGVNPSLALIDASAEASLVVVGSRGRGGFRGLLLGSVGRDLVGHANSPVVIVHGRPTHA